MDKGLVFFTLSAVCFWLVFDDLAGKQRLSNIAAMLTPDIPGIGEVVKDKIADTSKNVSEKIVESSPGLDGLPGARKRQSERNN
jgi:hypothetical protein